MKISFNQFRNLPKGTLLVVALIFILTLALLGCTGATVVTPMPENTSTLTAATSTVSMETPFLKSNAYQPMLIRGGSGQFYMRLPDGSEIILDPDSEIEITKFMGFSTNATEYEIVIHRGGMLIISNLPKGQWFTVKSPKGYIARVTGSIIHIKLDIENGEFEAECVEGDCELGPNDQALLKLAAKDLGWLDANGNFQGTVAVDLDKLRATYGTAIPTEASSTATLTPSVKVMTPTATATPNIAATATAACVEFQKAFPSTPCPTESP